MMKNFVVIQALFPLLTYVTYMTFNCKSSIGKIMYTPRLCNSGYIKLDFLTYCFLIKRFERDERDIFLTFNFLLPPHALRNGQKLDICACGQLHTPELDELVLCQFASGRQLIASPRTLGLCNQTGNKADWVAVFQAE